jgi:hypothetical protein
LELFTTGDFGANHVALVQFVREAKT